MWKSFEFIRTAFSLDRANALRRGSFKDTGLKKAREEIRTLDLRCKQFASMKKNGCESRYEPMGGSSSGGRFFVRSQITIYIFGPENPTKTFDSFLNSMLHRGWANSDTSATMVTLD